jgi:hypothetical protein
MEATSIDGLVAHCQSARFTGILRMSAREGIGEVWFLSGIADEIHFGVSTADEALDRMRKATQPMYELVQRLPHPAGGFKRTFPSKGSVAAVTPVTLMRYCERYALTCTLEIESTEILIEAKYELGELVSVETTADDDAITAMLEAKEGTYAFTLPKVELPAGTAVLPPTSLSESLAPPESLGFRALLEAKPLAVARSGRTLSDEAEVKRKTVEIARQQKAATIAIKKEEPKPVESKPVTTAAPTPTPTPKTRSVPPRPAAKPETQAKEKVEIKDDAKPAAPTPEPEKVEAKPTATPDAIQDDAKPAAAPLVEEQVAAPKDEEPAPDKPAKPRKRRAKKPPEPPPPAKRSMTWWVVSVLFAVGIAYLLWTHRI